MKSFWHSIFNRKKATKYLFSLARPRSAELKVVDNVELVVCLIPWVDLFVALLPHVLFQDIPVLEYFLAENAHQVVQTSF